MVIPEITEQQVAIMREMCTIPGMDVFSQASPIPSDPLQESIQALQGQRDVDHLIELGFVKEITADHLDKLKETQEKTGRTWRIFQIQPLGRAMWQLPTPSLVN